MSQASSSIIYHYTSVEGFLNILQSNSLWLSSLSEMNDSHEGLLHLPAFENALEKVKMTDGDMYDLVPHAQKLSLPIKKLTPIADNLNTSIQNFIKKINYTIEEELHAHFCCFSKESDKLSQWRGYGDNGKGVAIGFSRESFESQISEEHSCKSILDIVYEYNEQESMCVDILKLFKQDSLNAANNRVTRDHSYYINKLFNIPYTFKHASFQEEKEVRLLYITNEKNHNLNFRVVNGNIISYYEQLFKPQAIKKIILGPRCNLNINSKDFKCLMLRKYQHLLELSNGVTSLQKDKKNSDFRHIKYSSSTYR